MRLEKLFGFSFSYYWSGELVRKVVEWVSGITEVVWMSIDSVIETIVVTVVYTSVWVSIIGSESVVDSGKGSSNRSSYNWSFWESWDNWSSSFSSLEIFFEFSLSGSNIFRISEV